MQINYKNNNLQKSLTIPKEIVKNYGQRAKKVKQRMEEFNAANNLEVIKKIPAANLHPLLGNKKGEFAVDISGNWRIVFVPDHETLPLKEDGALSLADVTSIKIIKVEDYH